MKSTKRSLKKRLNDNKVYFEIVGIIVPILLSVLALIISIQAKNISEIQLNLSKSQILPLFRFKIDLIYNNSKDFYDQDFLRVYNDGSSIVELEHKVLVFIQVELEDKKNASLKKLLMPLENYYRVSGQTGESKGELAYDFYSINGVGNNEKFIQISNDFRKLLNEKGSYGSIELKRYIRLNYKDVFGATHEDYFAIDGYGSRKMEKEEVNKIVDIYVENKKNKYRLSFDDLSAIQIYNISEKL
ncbi:hypothetical protein [Brevibacillus choshinensis]|uniref:hypothetical protein n=1 Tax=Brevibacillus choshinensis TaxID=54911 RepID=UPI002E1D2B98|nr:hypothetical protein [Brevibacillus choshinensis]